MTAFLALLTRALITVLFALTALLRFYGDDGFHLPYPPAPSLTSASGSSAPRPFWWWLISALSGTLEIEADIERLKRETAQLKSENARLRELNSRIDSLFSKYGISSTSATPPEQL